MPTANRNVTHAENKMGYVLGKLAQFTAVPTYSTVDRFRKNLTVELTSSDFGEVSFE